MPRTQRSGGPKKRVSVISLQPRDVVNKEIAEKRRRDKACKILYWQTKI